MELATFNQNQKIIDTGDQIIWGANNGINPVILVNLITFKHVKKTIYSVIVVIALSATQVRAEGPEIIPSNFRHISFPVSTVVEEFIQFQKQRVSNSIEFFSLVSLSGEVMTKPNTQEEGKDSPKESNKTEAGLKKEGEVTQEDIEHFKSSIIGMLLSSLVMIPLGIMFSECISPRILAKRKRWMKLHTLKAERFHRDNPNGHYMMPRKTFCQWLWF